MKKTIVILSLALVGNYSAVFGQKSTETKSSKWQKVGDKTVDFKNDRDEISISNSDRFSSLKFKVTEGSIELLSLQMHYENKQHQDVKVKSLIKPLGESEVITLNNNHGKLEKVVFIYKTVPNSADQKAKVELWALKTNETVKANETDGTNATKASKTSSSGTVPSPAVVLSDKTGWQKIAERTVDFAKDRDEVLVLGADRFASIKLKVTDAPVELLNLQIFYEDGEKQDVWVNSPIEVSGETRVIALNGGERDIQKISFEYKTLKNRNDEKAHVEIWGLKTNAVKQ